MSAVLVVQVRQEREQKRKGGRSRRRNRKRSAQEEGGREEEEEGGGKRKRRKKKQREDKEESQKGGSGEKEQKAVKKRHRTSTSGRGRRRDRSGGEDKSGTVPEGGKRVRSSRHGRRLDTRDLLLMDLDDEDDEEEDDDASWHDGDPLLGQSSSSDEDELAQEDALGSVPFWLKQRALATAEEPATQVQREAAAAAAEGSGEGAHKASWFPGETHLHMDSIKEEDPQNVVHWPLVLMRNELAVNSGLSRFSLRALCGVFLSRSLCEELALLAPGPLEQALVEVPEVGSSQSSSLLQLNPRLGCTAG